MQSKTRFIASRKEELNRELKKELRKVIFVATLKIFAMIGSRARLKELEVGKIIEAIL